MILTLIRVIKEKKQKKKEERTLLYSLKEKVKELEETVKTQAEEILELKNKSGEHSNQGVKENQISPNQILMEWLFGDMKNANGDKDE